MRSHFVAVVTALVVCVACAQAKEIDLLKTSVGHRLDDVVQHAAIGHVGNQGSARITRLVLDSDSGDVTAEIKVDAKHSWGKVKILNHRYDVAVDVAVNGTLKANLSTGQILSAGITLPIGRKSVTPVPEHKFTLDFGKVTISADAVLAALNGDFAAAVMDSIPNPGTVTKQLEDDYAKDKAAREGAHPGKLYFASKQFVDEIKPTTALSDAISLILTAGASSEEIMVRVGALARNEEDGIVHFFETQGLQQADAAVNQLLVGKRLCRK